MDHKNSRSLVKENIKFLLNKDDILTYGDFLTLIKCHKQTLNDALLELQKENVIKKIKRGRYSLKTAFPLKKYQLLLKDLQKLQKKMKSDLRKKDYQFQAYWHIMHRLLLISKLMWGDIVGTKWKQSGDFQNTSKIKERCIEDMKYAFDFLHEHDPQFAHKLNYFVDEKLKEQFEKSVNY